MISIGGVVLNDGLIWEERFQYTGVVQEVRNTLGGKSKVYSAGKIGPAPITLKSLSDQGWQTYAIAAQLAELAKVPDGQYTLVLDSEIYTVSFAHANPPVIEVSPLLPSTTAAPTDYCLLTLKLVSYLPV